MRFFALLFFAVILGATAASADPVPYSTIRTHLIKYEGYRHHPYRDGPNGWSVGVGHNLTIRGEKPRPYYSSIQIERQLTENISWALDAARRGIRGFDDLPHDIQCVAIGVAFTVGRTGFERFYEFRTALSYRSYRKAAMELQLSRWSRQVSPSRVGDYLRILRARD